MADLHGSVAPHFLVGRDRHGWVVVETHGLCGGLFCDEAAALRYAKRESQGCSAAIEISRRPLDLKIS
ncbi:MAG TPA: hypothetical protein VKA03_08355 [Methylovirgula sp.]|nr:hypothetical protein [Methylovirgula sp.]